jgi:methylenetetrahydrofolate dehydrogenase (NADP+)/methenyltetrahydrofolate cyclohydrolase
MIVDGKAIAADIYSELQAKFDSLGRKVKLGIVVVGKNSVIESFVRIKTRAAQHFGIEVVRVDLSDSSSTQEVVAALEKLAEETDAVITQLPMPKQVDTQTILSAIPPKKDVDALNPTIAEDEHPVFAPVALAVVEILKRAGVDPNGKRTVVVGAGRLVGAPAAALLKRLGARVSMFTLEEGSIADLKDADIVISGAGKPGLIKPEHLKPGVALIDAGTSEQGGKVIGDADPACAKIASVFTPVPGGVGPVAVAMIFMNLIHIIENTK